MFDSQVSVDDRGVCHLKRRFVAQVNARTCKIKGDAKISLSEVLPTLTISVVLKTAIFGTVNGPPLPAK